jgi:hypothetical protein
MIAVPRLDLEKDRHSVRRCHEHSGTERTRLKHGLLPADVEQVEGSLGLVEGSFVG